jgi:hypothetical protein
MYPSSCRAPLFYSICSTDLEADRDAATALRKRHAPHLRRACLSPIE